MSPSYEDTDLELAMQALKRDEKLSVRSAARIYNVPEPTLRRRRNGISSRRATRQKSCKLSKYEEELIVQYIFDLDLRAFLPRLCNVENMANQLLRDRDVAPVGVNWALNFVRR